MSVSIDDIDFAEAKRRVGAGYSIERDRWEDGNGRPITSELTSEHQKSTPRVPRSRAGRALVKWLGRPDWPALFEEQTDWTLDDLEGNADALFDRLALLEAVAEAAGRLLSASKDYAANPDSAEAGIKLYVAQQDANRVLYQAAFETVDLPPEEP